MAFIAGAAIMAVAAGTSAYMQQSAAKDAAGRASSIGAQNYAANQQAIQQGQTALDFANRRTIAAERTRFNLGAGLGEIGTYEQSFEDYRAANPLDAATYGTKKGGLFNKKTGLMDRSAGMFKKMEKTFKDPVTGEKTKIRDWKLDPSKATAAMQDTRQYRMLSYQTAQADQLLRREGPLWDEIQESVQGPIFEGSAMQHQQMLEQLSRAAATQGGARQSAVRAATQLQAEQNIARDRQNALWQSNLAMIQWSQENARTQLAFNRAWVSEEAGLRDSFNQMLNRNAEMIAGQIMPNQIAANNGLASHQMAASSLKQAAANARAQGIADIGSAIGGGLMMMDSTPMQFGQKTATTNVGGGYSYRGRSLNTGSAGGVGGMVEEAVPY